MTFSLAALNDAPWQLLATASVLLVLILGFGIFFVIPAIRLRLLLGRLLRELRGKTKWSVTELQGLFEPDRTLAHLWQEFRDTLHEQKEERRGQIGVVAWRATVPAESYFNTQYIVETRLRTELFKHFPGIFTGFGIIGTFLGLIQGLQAFKVSEDPVAVRQSLEYLLHGVFEAFLVSASAILLAMLVTLVEKAFLASLYRCSESLAQHLDGLFTTGAGEDYLSRLVVASEDSASQAKILKDSLVGDLKVILQEITDQQIRASSDNSSSLGRQITEGINEGLQGPLNRIGGIVEAAAGDQSETASRMLKDVMASFSQRLSDLFGNQIGGINSLNQQTAQSMQNAVSALHQLVGNIESASLRSGNAMSDRLARAVEDTERRQAEINEQTRALIDSIRQQVAASHTETNDKLQATIASLGEQVGNIVAGMQAHSINALADHQTRETALAARTERMVNSMGDTVSEVVGQLAGSTSLMQQSISSLERTTTGAIDKMSMSARTLEQGATAFAAAGERVSGVMERSAATTTKIAEVAGALTSASAGLQTVVAEYGNNRDSMVTLVSEVRVIVDSAKREAAMTESTLARLQVAADTLARAQHDVNQYLERVSGVIEDSHEAFANGMLDTLSRSNTEFHTKLSTAVNLLHSAIQDLETTLSDISVGK